MIPALLFCLSLQLAAPTPVTGIVRDTTGAVVPGATVTIDQATSTAVTTSRDGRFTLSGPAAGLVTLTVSAPGFAQWRQTVARSSWHDVTVVLQPAGVLDTLTVTPTRTAVRVGDVPGMMTVLGRDDVQQSAAVMADDVMRRLPSFSLFRRTSSIAAHPTTQGVSLRGIGPSGVSRTLVLVDGVPFNDPFGGWVYWSRLALEHADQIEVVEGATSNLYGNYALGGVINVVAPPAAPSSLVAKVQTGNLGTNLVDGYASHAVARVGASVDAAWYRTNGYAPVVAINPAGLPERGLVDNNVSLDMRRVNLRVNGHVSANTTGVLRAGYFRERRNNGKHSTFTNDPEDNSTEWTSASVSLNTGVGGHTTISASASLDTGTLRSRFLAVPAATPPRSIGRMTLAQRVPASAYNAQAQARRTVGDHAVSLGGEWRWVDGDSEEDGLDAQTGTTVTLRRISGGTQRGLGAFAQYVYSAPVGLTVTVGVRADAWRTYDGHNLEFSQPSGTPTAAHAPTLVQRRDTVVSPRVAAMYRVTDRISVWGNWAGGFRAPTLNELYRQFRVGTVLTLANAQLGPERLRGGEAGVQIAAARALSVRAAWFDSRMTNPVSNVTIATAGANVTQQRQNLGATRVTGVQVQTDARIGAVVRFSAAYIHQRSAITRNPANVVLEGKALPQVPRHRASFTATFSSPRWATASLEVLALGRQFDDDLNVRTVPGLSAPGLPGYAVVSAYVSRGLGRRFSLFASAQNLLGHEYFVGTLPTTVGSPRMVSAGVRVEIGR